VPKIRQCRGDFLLYTVAVPNLFCRQSHILIYSVLLPIIEGNPRDIDGFLAQCKEILPLCYMVPLRNREIFSLYKKLIFILQLRKKNHGWDFSRRYFNCVIIPISLVGLKPNSHGEQFSIPNAFFPRNHVSFHPPILPAQHRAPMNDDNFLSLLAVLLEAVYVLFSC
jgi:hypothetical protein